MSARAIGITLVLCLLLTGRARAQQPAPDDSLAATVFDPLVTTATRDERNLTDVPAAISVVDSSTARQGRTIGLHEALRMLPGVQVASRYGTDEVSVGIRGSGIRTRIAVRGVAVLLDGIALTEPDGGARLDLVEYADVRQIEVVRGPASALYGGASGGVVNLLQRTGRESRGAVLRAQYGSFGTEKVDGYVGDMFAAGRGSLAGFGSYTQSDGYRAHSRGDAIRVGANADYRIGERTRIALEGNASDIGHLMPGSLTQTEFDRDPDAAAPAAVPFDLQRDDERYRIGLRSEHSLGLGGTTTMVAYFFYGGRNLGISAPAARLRLVLHRVQGGFRARAARLGGSPIDLTAGFDYDNLYGPYRRYTNAPFTPVDTLTDDGRLAAPAFGLYGQAEWHALRTVDLTAGLRWDRNPFRFESYTPGKVPAQDTTFNQLSPKFTASWRPVAGRTFYASVSRGFEVPVFGELVTGPGDPLRTIVPKSLWNYELGAHALVGSRTLLDAALFYQDVDNEFVPASDASGLPLSENASRSRNVGIELGATTFLTSWLSLLASYTWSDFRFTEYRSGRTDSTGAAVPVDYSGNRLPGVPVHRVTAEARYRSAARIEASVQFEWQGEVFVESGNATTGTWYVPTGPGRPPVAVPFRSVPGRALVHLAARWQPGPVAVFGSVENLVGHRYVASLVVNDALGRFYESGPGTVLTLGASVHAWPTGAP